MAARHVTGWFATEMRLDVLGATMDSINETPRKEQTAEQRARLDVLRRLCREVGEHRYDLLKEKK